MYHQNVVNINCRSLGSLEIGCILYRLASERDEKGCEPSSDTLVNIAFWDTVFQKKTRDTALEATNYFRFESAEL